MKPSKLNCAFFISLLMGLTFLSGCSSNSSGYSTPVHGDVAPASGETSGCDDIITRAKIETFNASHQLARVGGIGGTGFATCQNTRGDSTAQAVTGYSGIAVYPALSLGAQSRFVSPNHFTFDAALEQPNDDDLAAIGAAFVDSRGQKPPVEIETPRWEDVILDDLPLVKFEIRQNQIDLDVPLEFVSEFQQAQQRFAAGQAAMVFAFETFSAQPRMGSFRAGESVHLGRLQNTTAGGYLDDLWKRIGRQDPALVEKSMLAYSWMGRASLILQRQEMKMSFAEVSQRWPQPVTLAQSLWEPRKRHRIVPIDNCFTALHFLTKIDPSTSALIYQNLADQLEPFFPLDHEALYAELVDLIEVAKIDTSQLRVTLDLAWALESMATREDIWTAARKAATAVGFDPRKTQQIAPLAKWLGDIHAAQPIDVAVEWVSKKGVDPSRLKSLQSLYQFLTQRLITSVAYDRMVNLGFMDSLSSADLEAYQSTFNWLAQYFITQVCFQKVDRYYLYEHISAEQSVLLKDAFTWLTRFKITSQAIEKAEGYLFTHQMTADQYKTLQTHFAKYSQSMTSSTALEKAEADTFGDN